MAFPIAVVLLAIVRHVSVVFALRCTSPAIPPFASLTVRNDTAIFTCADGFVLLGLSQLSCNRTIGAWEPTNANTHCSVDVSNEKPRVWHIDGRQSLKNNTCPEKVRVQVIDLLQTTIVSGYSVTWIDVINSGEDAGGTVELLLANDTSNPKAFVLCDTVDVKELAGKQGKCRASSPPSRFVVLRFDGDNGRRSLCNSEFRIFSGSAEPPSSALCDDGQFYSAGQCFATIPTSERSLLGAAVQCKKLGGELALPEAPVTRDYLLWALMNTTLRNRTTQAASIYGIDLHQDAPDGLWTSISGASTTEQSWNTTEDTILSFLPYTASWPLCFAANVTEDSAAWTAVPCASVNKWLCALSKSTTVDRANPIVSRERNSPRSALEISKCGSPEVPAGFTLDQTISQPALVGHSLDLFCSSDLSARLTITCLSNGSWSARNGSEKRCSLTLPEISTTITTTTTTTLSTPNYAITANAFTPTTQPDRPAHVQTTYFTYTSSPPNEASSIGVTTRRLSIDKPCDALQPPAHGTVTLIGGQNSSTLIAEHQCERGYRLIGPNRRHCLKNGTWSGISPQCLGILCERPPYIKHGRYLLSADKIVVGVKLLYSCNAGYRLDGVARLSCLDSGLWSNSWPVCQEVLEDCPPVNIDNGRVEYVDETRNPGDRVLLECDRGFALSPKQRPPVIVCTKKGTWNDTLTCRPIDTYRMLATDPKGAAANDKSEHRNVATNWTIFAAIITVASLVLISATCCVALSQARRKERQHRVVPAPSFVPMLVRQPTVPIICNGQKFYRAGTVCERSFNNSTVLPARAKTLTAAAAAKLQHQTRNFQKTGHLLSSGCTVVAVSGTIPRKAQQLAKELRKVSEKNPERIYERPATECSDRRERRLTQSLSQQGSAQNASSNEGVQQQVAASSTATTNCSLMKQQSVAFCESPRNSYASSEGSGSGEYERVRYTIGDLAPYSSQCNSKGTAKRSATCETSRKATDRHLKKLHEQSAAQNSLRRNSATYNAPASVDEVYVPDSVFCREEVKPRNKSRYRSLSPSPHQSESSARSSQTPEDPQPVEKAPKPTPGRRLTRKNSLPSSIYSTLPGARAQNTERNTHTLPTKFRRSHSYSDGTDLRTTDRHQHTPFRLEHRQQERRNGEQRRGGKTVSVNYVFDPASGTIHQVRNTTEYFTADGRPFAPLQPADLSEQKVTGQHQTPRAVKRRNRTSSAAAHAVQELANNVLLLDELSLARLLETDMLGLDKSFVQPVVCAGAYAPRLAQRPFTPSPATTGASLRTAMPAVTRSSGRTPAPKRHSDASTSSANDGNDSRHWDAKKFKYRNKKVQFSDVVT
uniref:Sushi domain-containing protein n=1 Tax=Plectus sambesii TaxID=2011161 RepID=A0A914VIA1_9BILA